ncbi:MAG: NAD(P)H-hydrate dehydratase [Candidatus Hodarchaeales archaeon]|jgi:NAD(P)H-hydrate epimerase
MNSDPDTLTTLEMSIIDINADYLGVKRKILMENAGSKLADLILKVCEEKSSKNVIIFAGKGGNGGDGFVAARHLSKKIEVTVYLLGSKKNITKKSTLANLKVLENMFQSVKIFELKDSQEIKQLEAKKTNFVLVDAIFGTGIKGKIKGIHFEVISYINACHNQGNTVISVDTPSGIDPNSGDSRNIYVEADYTCVFHKLKRGLTSRNSGNLIIVPIGIPPEAELISGPGDLLAIMTGDKWSKKGDKGRILIIGGNNVFSGAPALAAMGVLRAGADLVTVLAPKTTSHAIRTYSPELIVQSYDSTHLKKDYISTDLLINQHVVLLGPGLGRHPQTKEAVLKIQEICKKEDFRLVIDADALHLIDPNLLYSNVILTPHAGEFLALTDITLPTGFQTFPARITAVQKVTSQSPATWLVKGPWDIISNKEKTKINKTGTPEMTQGGTGDVLAGLVAGFFSQSHNPFYSATVGAFINGKAGQLTKNDFSVINLLEKIPTAINDSKQFIGSD